MNSMLVLSCALSIFIIIAARYLVRKCTNRADDAAKDHKWGTFAVAICEVLWWHAAAWYSLYRLILKIGGGA